jgi:coenzyme F420 hydrogenase subunit delta
MPVSGQSDLPEYCLKPTLVLGCGNILFGDDGFGCALVEYTDSRHRVPDDVCMLDAGTGVRKLLFTLCLSAARPRRLLIVDALDAGRSPGELFELDPAGIPPIKLDDFSMHQIPTSNLLRELQDECGVEVRVLACQTGPLPQEISPGLSPPVQKALRHAAEWLVHEYLPNHDRQPCGRPDEPKNHEPARLVACKKGDHACR